MMRRFPKPRWRKGLPLSAPDRSQRVVSKRVKLSVRRKDNSFKGWDVHTYARANQVFGRKPQQDDWGSWGSMEEQEQQDIERASRCSSDSSSEPLLSAYVHGALGGLLDGEQLTSPPPANSRPCSPSESTSPRSDCSLQLSRSTTPSYENVCCEASESDFDEAEHSEDGDESSTFAYDIYVVSPSESLVERVELALDTMPDADFDVNAWSYEETQQHGTPSDDSNEALQSTNAHLILDHKIRCSDDIVNNSPTSHTSPSADEKELSCSSSCSSASISALSMASTIESYHPSEHSSVETPPPRGYVLLSVTPTKYPTPIHYDKSIKMRCKSAAESSEDRITINEEWVNDFEPEMVSVDDIDLCLEDAEDFEKKIITPNNSPTNLHHAKSSTVPKPSSTKNQPKKKMAKNKYPRYGLRVTKKSRGKPITTASLTITVQPCLQSLQPTQQSSEGKKQETENNTQRKMQGINKALDSKNSTQPKTQEAKKQMNRAQHRKVIQKQNTMLPGEPRVKESFIKKGDKFERKPMPRYSNYLTGIKNGMNTKELIPYVNALLASS